MNFSKKVNYTLLAFLILLNIALRYPTSSHEMGADSFFIHGLANSISQNGCAKWVIHPLSVFGLYPYSYSSGVPYLLSGISQSTGLNMEIVIFFLGIGIALIGLFSAYLMAKEIKNDDLFVFLTAFCFSTAPMFITLTTWTTSTRHLFLCLLPLFIFTLLRYHNKKDKRYLLLFMILFIALTTIHRMMELLLPVFIAYFVAWIITKYIKNMKISNETLANMGGIMLLIFLAIFIVIITNNPVSSIVLIPIAYCLSFFVPRITKINKISKSSFVSFGLLLLFLSAFFIQFLKISIYKNAWYDYQTGFFFEGTQPYMLILNMATNYIGHIGILIIFSLIGLFFIIFKQKRDFKEWFILLSILFILPLFAYGTYVSIFLLPFFSVLAGYGIIPFINMKRIKKYTFPTFLCCLLISLSFSGFMINHWNHLPLGNTAITPVVDDETYSASLFIRDYGYGTFICSNSVLGYRMSTYSGLPLFPGDCTWTLAYGFIDHVEPVSLSEFTPTKRFLYTTNNTAQNDYNMLLTLDCDNATAKEILSKYNIHYYVENNNMQSQDKFFKSAREKRYKIYDDGVESVWYLGWGIT